VRLLALNFAGCQWLPASKTRQVPWWDIQNCRKVLARGRFCSAYLRTTYCHTRDQKINKAFKISTWFFLCTVLSFISSTWALWLELWITVPWKAASVSWRRRTKKLYVSIGLVGLRSRAKYSTLSPQCENKLQSIAPAQTHCLVAFHSQRFIEVSVKLKCQIPNKRQGTNPPTH